LASSSFCSSTKYDKAYEKLKEDSSIIIDLQILVKPQKVVHQKLTTVFTTKSHIIEHRVVAEGLSFYLVEGHRLGSDINFFSLYCLTASLLQVLFWNLWLMGTGWFAINSL